MGSKRLSKETRKTTPRTFQKQQNAWVTPERRAKLIERYARIAGLTPEQIALKTRSQLRLVNAILEDQLRRRSEVPMLILRVHGSYKRRLGRVPKNKAKQVTELSRKTEEYAQQLLRRSRLAPPRSPGFDLVLPVSGGELKFEVKQCLEKDSNAFILLNSKNGKLVNRNADEFLAFTLQSLYLIKGSELQEFVERYHSEFLQFRKGQRSTVFVPLEELFSLGVARKIPYGTLVPKPPHFP